GANGESIEARIGGWGRAKGLEAVVWTSLPSNFQSKKGNSFSVERAIAHLQGLSRTARVKSAEYIWRAPLFVQTPLRAALEVEPWFPRPVEENG
ncbi:MAG: hypothetical protein RQ751_14585, partial [Longimicrobiales bacterium]|nr:hypothetical protein [Longimicrobiales bacterium]